MTIEGLSWLRSEIVDCYSALGQEDMSKGDLLIQLIDAEIARLSVTDEDIRETIKVMQAYSDHNTRYCEPVYAKMFDLAIQALQAYRTEPCEWCEEYDLNVCGYIQHGGQVMDAFNWSYCPNCGRKLEATS